MKKYFNHLLGLAVIVVILFSAAFSMPFFIKGETKNIEDEIFSSEETYYKREKVERKTDSDAKTLSEDETRAFVELALKELKKKQIMSLTKVQSQKSDMMVMVTWMCIFKKKILMLHMLDLKM